MPLGMGGPDRDLARRPVVLDDRITGTAHNHNISISTVRRRLA